MAEIEFYHGTYTGAQIDAGIAAANAAAPQATTYTKTETDALLSGKADLVDGKVPASELPSYVDDVLEYTYTTDFPATGESGKIYVATSTNRTYRWSGSAYVEISESLALGETSSTAYAGDKGKANADAITAIKDGTTIDSFGDVETALSLKADSSALATVATSGNYNDLSNKPTLGTAAAANVATSLDSSSNLPTAAQVSTALAGKQATLVVGTNLDNVPTSGSTNPITSGAVYTVVGDINTVLEEVL